MDQKPYSLLAEFYAYLMRKIDYKDWSEYLIALFRNFACNDDNILEIAGGVGTIASHLKEFFPNIYLSDLSREMLFKCLDPRLSKVCCDMTRLPFNNSFDIIYSTFDSVNYLMTEEDLLAHFREIKRISNEDSIFLFDASLEKNSKKYEKYLNRKGRFKDISFIQKSTYVKEEKIHYNYFEITLPDKTVINETHKQRIYDFETYFEVIDDAGLYVVDCFDAFSFDKADEKSLRAQFVTKKKR